MKTIPLDQLLAERYTPEEIADIDRWVATERAKIALRELRKLLGLTQAKLAARIKTSQAQLSAMEGREDWLLSTVRGYVEALGGELEVRAVFGDRSLRLHLGEPKMTAPAKPRTKTRTKGRTAAKVARRRR